MANIQPLNATFYAFRKRDKGGALLGTTLAYLVLLVVIAGVFIWLNLSSIQAVSAWYMNMIQQAAQSGGPPDFSTMPQSIATLGGAYFLFVFVLYLLLAAYEAACLRWMVRGERGGLLGLSLGADTWRVWLGYWIWLLILIGFYIFVLLTLAVSGGAIAVAAGGKGGNTAPAIIGAVVAFLLAGAACIYVSVRLAPGAATSIIAKRFAMFSAWGATRGRFWALLGSFVLIWLLYLVAILVIEFIIGATMAGTMMGTMAGLGPNPDPSAVIGAVMSPVTLALFVLIYVLVLAVAMVFVIALFGVNARAALAAAEEGKIPGVEPPQAAVFN